MDALCLYNLMQTLERVWLNLKYLCKLSNSPKLSRVCISIYNI